MPCSIFSFPASSKTRRQARRRGNSGRCRACVHFRAGCSGWVFTLTFLRLVEDFNRGFVLLPPSRCRARMHSVFEKFSTATSTAFSHPLATWVPLYLDTRVQFRDVNEPNEGPIRGADTHMDVNESTRGRYALVSHFEKAAGSVSTSGAAAGGFPAVEDLARVLVQRSGRLVPDGAEFGSPSAPASVVC